MPTLRQRASLFFPYPEPTARAIAGALSPETHDTEVPKTRGDVSADATGLRVELAASDVASLRAAVNSYLRWVDAAERAGRIGRGVTER